MRKAFRLPLLSLILLIGLTTTCLGDKKSELDVFDLIKHAPLFGHAHNTKEFTYIGIYYPSFMYNEETNKFTVLFEKVDERSVEYSFKLDCPPFVPLKKKIKVEETAFTPIQPESSTSVDLNTACTFVGTTGKEPVFKEIGDNLKEWIGPDWSLQMPKSEYVPLGPGERQDWIQETLEFSLRQVRAEMMRETAIIEAIQKGKLAQLVYKIGSSYSRPEKPKEPPVRIKWPRPVMLPDQCFARIDTSFIGSLKKEIIEPDIRRIIAKLPFRWETRKVHLYVYLPAPDQYRVLSHYEFAPQLGLKEIELPFNVPQLR